VTPEPLKAGISILKLACLAAVAFSRGVAANRGDALRLANLVQTAAADVMEVLAIAGRARRALLNDRVCALAQANEKAGHFHLVCTRIKSDQNPVAARQASPPQEYSRLAPHSSLRLLGENGRWQWRTAMWQPA
jgi:hypothetical protein